MRDQGLAHEPCSTEMPPYSEEYLPVPQSSDAPAPDCDKPSLLMVNYRRYRRRRFFRRLTIALVALAIIFACWWRLIFLKMGKPDPVAQCGDCHCILDGSGCPPLEDKPPMEFSGNLLSRLRSQVPMEEDDIISMSLTNISISINRKMHATDGFCDPYHDDQCEMVPPPDEALLDLGETAICAYQYFDATKNRVRRGTNHSSSDIFPPGRRKRERISETSPICESGATYRMVTYPSLQDATEDGAIPTHAGHCGVCSTTQDLAAYLEFMDLRTHGQFCAKKGLMRGSLADVRRCYEDTLGFTPPCAAIWAANSAYTARECLRECIYQGVAFNPPNNNGPAPTCGLNKCLRCDEDVSGPIFQRYAGRTRRRAGLLSAIARPCSSLHPNIRHDVCQGDDDD